MNIKQIITIFAFSVTSISTVAADSVHHSGQASKHTALSTAHGVSSTAKVASAVVAVPLVIAGSTAVSVGTASLKAGKSMATSKAWDVQHNRPLEITEITITADPAPNQVIVIQKNNKSN